MNIWVNCREIKWDENDPELPTSFKSFPLAEEWVENKTLKEAIDDKLSEYYDVKADCTDFTVYSKARFALSFRSLPQIIEKRI